jgi:hypothetical protein
LLKGRFPRMHKGVPRKNPENGGSQALVAPHTPVVKRQDGWRSNWGVFLTGVKQLMGVEQCRKAKPCSLGLVVRRHFVFTVVAVLECPCRHYKRKQKPKPGAGSAMQHAGGLFAPVAGYGRRMRDGDGDRSFCGVPRGHLFAADSPAFGHAQAPFHHNRRGEAAPLHTGTGDTGVQ